MKDKLCITLTKLFINLLARMREGLLDIQLVRLMLDILVMLREQPGLQLVELLSREVAGLSLWHKATILPLEGRHMRVVVGVDMLEVLVDIQVEWGGLPVLVLRQVVVAVAVAVVAVNHQKYHVVQVVVLQCHKTLMTLFQHQALVHHHTAALIMANQQQPFLQGLVYCAIQATTSISL